MHSGTMKGVQCVKHPIYRNTLECHTCMDLMFQDTTPEHQAALDEWCRSAPELHFGTWLKQRMIREGRWPSTQD